MLFCYFALFLCTLLSFVTNRKESDPTEIYSTVEMTKSQIPQFYSAFNQVNITHFLESFVSQSQSEVNEANSKLLLKTTLIVDP